MKYEELIGKRFNYVTIIGIVHKNGHYYAEYRCDCGNCKITEVRNILRNSTQSCGCKRNETISKKAKLRTKHNLRHHPLYRVWQDMKRRCYRPSNIYQANCYKNRGIKVCDEWLDDFKAFYDWAMANGFSDEKKNGRRILSLDRINNDGNYEPSNCRWATASVQNANKRPRFTENPELAKIRCHYRSWGRIKQEEANCSL